MSSALDRSLAERLAELEPALVPLVADQLAASLPMIGVEPALPVGHLAHHRNMRSTAERFHNIVQVGAGIAWGPVTFEFAWAARVLLPMGSTAEHQLTLIDTYFATARRLADWSAEERAGLDALAARMRAEVARTYHR